MTQEEPTPAPSSVRVLVVDDNRDAANTLATLLQIWGFEVRTAYSGREALEAVYAYRPDCVLSDIGLPGIDGYRLAEAIRHDEALNGISLIAISAHFDPLKAEAAGFDHHLVKPADPLMLLSMLRKLITMDKRLERAEKLIQNQVEVVTEARDLMKEVKGDVKEMKQEIKEVKQDIKEVKDDLKDIKERQDDAPPDPQTG